MHTISSLESFNKINNIPYYKPVSDYIGSLITQYREEYEVDLFEESAIFYVLDICDNGKTIKDIIPQLNETSVIEVQYEIEDFIFTTFMTSSDFSFTIIFDKKISSVELLDGIMEFNGDGLCLVQ